jgi:hypothetical protein
MKAHGSNNKRKGGSETIHIPPKEVIDKVIKYLTLMK